MIDMQESKYIFKPLPVSWLLTFHCPKQDMSVDSESRGEKIYSVCPCEKLQSHLARGMEIEIGKSLGLLMPSV